MKLNKDEARILSVALNNFKFNVKQCSKMKKICYSTYQYKGFIIDKQEHPQLYGKYAIFLNDEFIDRALTLKEAKSICDNYKNA